MTEVAGKKGMSKGCLVALIVAGVLIILVVALLFVCNAYKDDLVKSGTVIMINSAKSSVANNPPNGIDTVQFNRLADRFIYQFNMDSLDLERFGVSFQGMQTLMSEKDFDSSKIVQIQEMMYGYYPNLKELFKLPGEHDTGIISRDSAKTQ